MKDHMSESPWKETAKFYADLINRVGFPIVVSIFLGWLVLFKMEEQRTVLMSTLERVVGAIDKLSDKIEYLGK